MSDKTNEEKLRILKERLATIQQKEEINHTEEVERKKPISPVFEEELVNHPNIDPIEKTPRKARKNLLGLKYFIIFSIILLISYGGFFAYNNIDFNSLSESNNNPPSMEENIIYYKSSFNGNFIIVLNNFKKEKIANNEAKKLIEKGYNCDVLQLSGVSNSKEEVFQTFIGPFKKEEEANQYLNSTELISEGSVFKLQ